MKKVILSTIAAAALTTSAMAETKFGLGVDVMTNISNPAASTTGGTSFAANLGSTPVIRISIDGLAKGVRIEPRLAYADSKAPDSTGTTATAATLTVMGLGGYYDLSKTVSIGAYYDMYTLDYTLTTGTGQAVGTSMGVVAKAEAEIAKNFTIASELGLAQTASTNTYAGTAASELSDMHPVASVTLRMFF